MKRILSYILLVFLMSYLGISIFYYSGLRNRSVCTGVLYAVDDADDICLIDTVYVKNRVKNNFGEFRGLPLSAINLDSIVNYIESLDLIRGVEAYVSQKGILQVNIRPRKPVFRVFTVNGGDYIVDEERNFVKVRNKVKVRTMVVTGYVTEKTAVGSIFNLVKYISDHPLWNAMFEQIHVERSGEVILLSKLGNARVVLGKVENIKLKMDNFKLYLEQGVDKKGWIPYREINLKYHNQVIGVK